MSKSGRTDALYVAKFSSYENLRGSRCGDSLPRLDLDLGVSRALSSTPNLSAEKRSRRVVRADREPFVQPRRHAKNANEGGESVSKILFIPFSVVAGILAGIIGKKTFESLWSAFDDQKAPDPKQREIAWKKLIPALLLEGAILRAVRGLFDYGSRRAFSRLTGSWPGEERPDPT